MLPAIRIDRSLPVALRAQVQDQLRSLIECRALPAGTRLPSSRALAARLGVSRNTVLEAYEALRSEGLLVGRTGSGTFAARGPRGPRRVRPIDPRLLLRRAHYPSQMSVTADPDGNPLVLYA